MQAHNVTAIIGMKHHADELSLAQTTLAIVSGVWQSNTSLMVYNL